MILDGKLVLACVLLVESSLLDLQW